MGRHGHRNMYYATGLPGWMRFGFSPGWGGMPPGAQYLSQTGQLPQAMDWIQQQASTPAQGQPPTQSKTQTAPQTNFQQPQTPREQEIQILESQIGALEEHVRQIKNRINQLKR